MKGKHKLVKPSFIRKDDRGIFVEIINGFQLENISHGKMNKGAVMGNHYHKVTEVLFFLISGLVKIDIIDVKFNKLETVMLNENSGVVLKVLHAHAIRFLDDSTFLIAKSKKYNENDSDTFKLMVPES